MARQGGTFIYRTVLAMLRENGMTITELVAIHNATQEAKIKDLEQMNLALQAKVNELKSEGGTDD